MVSPPRFGFLILFGPSRSPMNNFGFCGRRIAFPVRLLFLCHLASFVWLNNVSEFPATRVCFFPFFVCFTSWLTAPCYCSLHPCPKEYFFRFGTGPVGPSRLPVVGGFCRRSFRRAKVPFLLPVIFYRRKGLLGRPSLFRWLLFSPSQGSFLEALPCKSDLFNVRLSSPFFG